MADAAFVRSDRLPPPGERQGFAALAPDLVVEVVSPSDRAAAVADKALRWIEAGTRLVWVVYPDRRLVAEHLPDGTVHLRKVPDSLDGRDVLPGFQVLVSELFESPPGAWPESHVPARPWRMTPHRRGRMGGEAPDGRLAGRRPGQGWAAP